AALRRLRKTGPSKRAAAVFGIGAVAAVAAMTVAGSLWAATTPDIDTDARPAELPATQTFSVCPGVPMLPEGSENGADVQFSADSSDAVSALAVAAASDLAGNIPGMACFPVCLISPQKAARMKNHRPPRSPIRWLKTSNKARQQPLAQTVP